MGGDGPREPHLGDELLRVAESVHAGEVSVEFRPGLTVRAKIGDKLLDVAEASQVQIEAVGDSQPIFYESMPKGEEGNRRAEIFVQN